MKDKSAMYKLNEEINYIVSGLERSGTSVMMQILDSGGLPTAYDNARPADPHNPRGYFELAGGKIINHLMDGTLDLDSYKGQIIKITALGLKYLPNGNYKIIFMTRNIDEVLDSMQKMGANIEREKDRILFTKLNQFSLQLLKSRADIDHIIVNYHNIIDSPEREIQAIGTFFGVTFDYKKAMNAIDKKLYRNKAEKN